MNKHEQKRYIKEYAATFVKEMTALITAGKVPEEWGGHELRLWFSIKAADNAKASNGRATSTTPLSATTSRGRCNP
jgi:hypothetical protein